jgi:hypothetical protein
MGPKKNHSNMRHMASKPTLQCVTVPRRLAKITAAMLFRDRRIRSHFHQQTRVAMPERVHSRTFDSQLVEDGPETVLDNFV